MILLQGWQEHGPIHVTAELRLKRNQSCHRLLTRTAVRWVRYFGIQCYSPNCSVLYNITGCKLSTQDVEVCPFCGKSSRWRRRLRQHIERFHSKDIVLAGLGGLAIIDRKVGWRSKAGQRRISYSDMATVVDSKMPRNHATRAQVFDVVLAVLQLCLVKAADDTE